MTTVSQEYHNRFTLVLQQYHNAFASARQLAISQEHHFGITSISHATLHSYNDDISRRRAAGVFLVGKSCETPPATSRATSSTTSHAVSLATSGATSRPRSHRTSHAKSHAMFPPDVPRDLPCDVLTITRTFPLQNKCEATSQRQST